MLECWETESENKPSFDALCNKIRGLETRANQVENSFDVYKKLFSIMTAIDFLHPEQLNNRVVLLNP